MILIMLIIGILFMLVCFYLGFTQYSFPMIFLGFAVMLFMGLFLSSEGVDIANGTGETPVGSGQYITIYETHTTLNDPVVNILATTFFYLPFAGLLLSTFFALRGWN